MNEYDSPMFTALVEISRLANTLQTVMDMGMDDITSRQWLPPAEYIHRHYRERAKLGGCPHGPKYGIRE